MPQTVQLLRTLTNNAPGALRAGELSVEMGGHTKLWVGSHTGNRLLISDNPAELPAAGAGYLSLLGGQLSGDLRIYSGATLRMGLVNEDPNSIAGGIEMYPGFGGFGVTGSTLNYNWRGVHQFLSGNIPVLQLADWGMQMQSALYLHADPTTPTMAATRNYVDTLVGAVEAVTKLAGAYNAASDLVRPVQGVSVAGPLPAPSAANQGWYLIIEVGGAGIDNAPPVEMAVGDWIISTGEAWVHLDLNLSTVEAANVAIVPIPGLFSTNVQGALEELPTKAYVDAHDPAVGNYLPIGGGNLTGQLGVAGAGISYNGSNLIAFSWTGSALAASVDASGNPGVLAAQQYVDSQDGAIYTWTGANFLTYGGGSLTGALSAPAFYATGVVQSSNGRFIAVNAGNNPSVTVWDSNLQAAAGMLLDGNNNLLFASMNGDGSYAAARAYIDPAGGLVTLGNIFCPGALFAHDIFLDPEQTYALYTGADGTRWLQFYLGWGYGWASNGDLVWSNPIDGTRNTIVGANGNCFNMDGTWHALSDARLKQDIADYTPGLDVIMQVRPRTFRRIADVRNEARDGRAAPRKIGIIAQEIEAVLPECVSVEARDLGDVHYDDLRHYDSSPLLYALVNAVKELNTRVTAGGL